MRKVFLLSLIALISISCSSKGTLSIQAGLVYQVGGSQAVARNQFHLLDESLEKVLTDGGLGPKDKVSAVDRYILSAEFPDDKESSFGVANVVILPHIKESATTDFEGKATFKPVKPGKYFLFGLTKTRAGYAIWNQPVEIRAGENTITLDQNNTARIY